MSKRATGQQLTRENYKLESDDDGISEPSVMASSEQMSKRKIAMPKRKMKLSTSNIATQENSYANSFSNVLKGNGAQATSSKSEENAKLIALNQQFKDKINGVLSTDPCTDLTSIIEKYNQYISCIFKVESTINTVSTVPVDQKPVNPFANAQFKPTASLPVATSAVSTPPAFKELESTKTIANDDVEMNSSSDEKDNDVKIQGPQFTINSNPIKSDSVFSFGKKKVEVKDDSDSESDIEIKGPSFNFTGSIKDNVFKLKKDERSELPKSEPHISAQDETANSISKEDAKPAFSFNQTASTLNAGTKSAFTFASTAANSEKNTNVKPTSAFSFGVVKAKEESTEPKETAKLSFGFNQNVAEDDAEKTSIKPQFTFGSVTNPTEKTIEAPKSAFTFGATSTNAEAGSDVPKTAFSFTQSKPSEQPSSEAPKPAFSFGNTNTATENKSEATKSAFNFGNLGSDSGKSEEVEKKSAFSFSTTNSTTNSNIEAPKSAFSFSSTKHEDAKDQDSTTKPKFSFNIGNSATENAASPPSFSFGKPAGTQDNDSAKKPAFTFGVSASTGVSTPSFSFGNTKSDNGKIPPSGGFKFSLPFEQKTGSSKPAITETLINEEQPSKTETNEESEKADGVDTSKPIDLQNGEEDENVLFSQRSKLMVFNPETKAYDSKGVGEMKLLQRKDNSGKVRLLCRSDGMGNILLNTSVIKSFKYTALSETAENLVKVPIVDAGGNLTTYVVKFKQKSDGRAFIKAIEDSKKDM